MNRPAEPARLHGWRLFSLLSLLVLIVTTLALWSQPQGVDALRSAIRVTARTSFALFLATFLASSLAALVPGKFTRGLLRERRFLGLAFAFSHAVHAVLIILYPETFWNGRSAAANIPGSVGYVFIVLLTMTSFPYAVKLLGARVWKGLHSTGTWVIAGVFLLSFYKRLPMGSWYPLGFGLIFSAIAFKLLAKLAVRLRRSARAALPNA